MSELVDQQDRLRFQREWQSNFAVSANAGSGKTTAISQRLAEMALNEEGRRHLQRTAVVTYTRKAASQIGAKARTVLMKRMRETGGADLSSLEHLDRAFFGTIHSFCILLAQRHGQTLGINLNPSVVQNEDGDHWEEFIEQDDMRFHSLPSAQISAFLRHVPLDTVLDLANGMTRTQARHLLARVPTRLDGPSEAVLQEILSTQSRTARGAAGLARNQQAAREWLERYRSGNGFLAIIKPQGTAAGIVELYQRFFAPLKKSLAEHAAVLAAELAERFREWRFARGIQTFADQIDAAMAVLHDPDTLEAIRREGWRIILDEAQDTDPQQFSVLVELARPPGAQLGTWPGRGGEPPRAGFFSMVGDGQQSIYGSRADLRNFRRHLEAFAEGYGGELLHFAVTFRAPVSVIDFLNTNLPPAFGPERLHNLGLVAGEGAEPPVMQVDYEPLAPGPVNPAGYVGRLELDVSGAAGSVERILADEVRQIAETLMRVGPGGLGVRNWGEVCLLAPRNQWLITARRELEKAGLKTALQMRQSRNGDNPAYAWVTGMLAAVCDPANTFEWVGVLREVFAVSDAELARVLRKRAADTAPVFHWDDPDAYSGELKRAIETLGRLILKVDEDGLPLAGFVRELLDAGELRQKALAIDPSGGVLDELDRLEAQAATKGLEGCTPRMWLDELLDNLDQGRASGKRADDAINLLSVHSAKGLEWPVVIPIGLWREVGEPPSHGMCLIPDLSGNPEVYFDRASMPGDTRESRQRERLRENVRLLYVCLTRAKLGLLLPWSEGFAKIHPVSFQGLWGADLAQLPAWEPRLSSFPSEEHAEVSLAGKIVEEQVLLPDLIPARRLPHELAKHVDAARAQRHDSWSEIMVPRDTAEDPISYGLWWHETMEFWPWNASPEVRQQYVEERLRGADELGAKERAERELALFETSDFVRTIAAIRWTRQAELGVFAPREDGDWIDGVIDLVLLDASTKSVWVVDWKTNRRRAQEEPEMMLARLAAEYAPQLQAYGRCLRDMFSGYEIRAWVFSTSLALAREITVAGN